jgi:hypothetical protein
MTFPMKPPMQGSSYEVGHYLKEITMAKTNSAGELCITVKTLESHDDRRIGSYYTMNFFTDKKRSAGSQRVWGQKMTSLFAALNITEITSEEDLQQKLLGETVTVEYWKGGAKRGDSAGSDPLPNFLPEKEYNPMWEPRPSTKAQAKGYEAPATTNEEMPDGTYEDYASFMDKTG